MGKSYKKNPAISGTVYKEGKRAANRRVRQVLKNLDVKIPNRSFKKIYPMWDVRDYREVAPSFENFYKEQLSRWKHSRYWSHGELPPTKKECWNWYQRWYKRK